MTEPLNEKNVGLSDSNAGLADAFEAIADPFEEVLNTLDEMEEFGLLSLTRQIGFVEVNGKKAQVQICVDTNAMNWVRVG